MMIKIERLIFNMFQENTYILSDESGECVIIDPGCHSYSEKQSLAIHINNEKLKPVKLLITHCHIDHILGNKFVCDTYGLLPEIHKNELTSLQTVSSYSSIFG